jgi:citrate lyase subunit beta / citryl-CoA lyase
MRARRSCLSVPVTQERFLEKADGSAADEVILDLEDSVPPAAKERARPLAVEALRRFEYRGKVRAVRVNACDSRWCFEDVVAVVEGAGDRLDCLVVPKVEGPEQVHFLEVLLGQLEAKLGLTRRVGLELQVESARGLERCEAIAAASGRVEALVFGPGDLGADLRMPVLTIGSSDSEYPGEIWHYFQARMLVAARARGVQAVDGPYAQVRDLEGLRASARRAAALGFDGKWALNPAQAEALNEVFAPSQDEFDRACRILEAYRRATEVEERGAVAVDGEMVDEATRRLAATMVERGRAVGMETRPGGSAGG